MLPDSGPCGYICIFVCMSAGWAPPGGCKDNKEENDALTWKGVAIATLSAEQHRDS